MHFNLPEQLAAQVASYDTTRKKLAATMAAEDQQVKKKKHLIILCMIDNKPRYTVQLTVDNSVMTVNQIADIGNKRLSDVERSTVEDAFKKALQQREKQLS